ncbi:hypothetical protein C900_00103 [Fulvivirga imtechensis AK7]|uniref:Uncharacterized protein n=1 Tax=Fulvivirga imtechensis AK7 TaxID=1237149 RepID=L8JXW9_9BACT|nr:hypothetical protein C900_00103 [Fulvivirga imtechensis AK7]
MFLDITQKFPQRLVGQIENFRPIKVIKNDEKRSFATNPFRIPCV